MVWNKLVGQAPVESFQAQPDVRLLIFQLVVNHNKKVCGKIIGCQDSTPDAFQPYSNNHSLTLDDGYVDGVSVTYNFPKTAHMDLCYPARCVSSEHQAWMSLYSSTQHL